MLQRHAVQKLHDEERMALLLPDLIDRADIGMVESRSSLSFSLEAGQGLGVTGEVIGQKLQGDKSVQGHVLGLVDHTHPAAAELLNDTVVRDGLADHKRLALCASICCAARSKMGARSAHSRISWTLDVTMGVEYSGCQNSRCIPRPTKRRFSIEPPQVDPAMATKVGSGQYSG